MRKFIFALVCLVLCVSAADAKRYIITVENNTRAKVNWDAFVTRSGGEVVKTFDFIDGALLDLPEEQAQRLMDRRAPGMTIEEDVSIYWLNQASAVDNLKKYSKNYGNNLIKKAPAAVSAAGNVAVSTAAPALKTTFPMEGEMPWGVARIKPNLLWKITEGEDVKVAVVDTGIDYDHPDIKANYAGGYNTVRPGASAKDDHGHGTHVAGIIAAVRDGKGITGVAPKAKLYGIKAMAKDGSGELSAIIRAVEWSIDNKMNIINMSISVGKDYVSLHKALAKAADNGITVICAAGNDSGPVNYPAKYAETIAVSACSPDDFSAPFTAKGPEVDFMAPGMYVPSTVMNGKYEEMHGTSQACPHVAGLAALLYNMGYKTPEQIREAIKKVSEPAEFVPANEQGAGIPNAAKIKKAE